MPKNETWHDHNKHAVLQVTLLTTISTYADAEM
jgi:hypothetical protein